MAIEAIAQLKSWFETADKPTQAQFAALIDAMMHRSDGAKLALNRVEGLVEAMNTFATQDQLAEVEVEVVNDLTTGGITKPLSAQQGVVLKGLIDAINALLTSDDVSLDELQEIVDYIKQNRADLDALSISSIIGLQAALDTLTNDVAAIVGVTDGNKGDISVLASGTDWQINTDGVTSGNIKNNNVGNTKLSDMATQTIKGRNTAGTGDPEDLTAAQVRAILNVEDGANNYVHPSHTGDVTGVTALTIGANKVTSTHIASGAVTQTKIQDGNVSLSKITSIAQNTLLGRVDSGTGVVQALTIAQLQSMLVAPRVSTIGSASSYALDLASHDQLNITSLTTPLSIENPGGVVSPITGRKLIFRIKDDGTTRALTWGTSFRAIGVTLPAATVANKTLYVGVIYNATDSKWDVVAVAQEA